jgi:hypothetical protein
METPRAEMITVRATTVVEPASPEADSAGALDVRVCAMRTGIIVKVTAAERDRLKAIVADRSSRQKHVWRARRLRRARKTPA